MKLKIVDGLKELIAENDNDVRVLVGLVTEQKMVNDRALQIASVPIQTKKKIIRRSKSVNYKDDSILALLKLLAVRETIDISKSDWGTRGRISSVLYMLGEKTGYKFSYRTRYGKYTVTRRK